MASLYKLFSLIEQTEEDISKARRDAEDNRDLEYFAALKISAWYRGVRLRCYLRHLNESAAKIQRGWRTFVRRREERCKLKEAVYQMRLAYYHQQATLIQKLWRGFYVRKYIFNYYAYNKYIKGLLVANEVMNQKLKEMADSQRAEEDRLKREAEEKARYEWTYKNHHLLSTFQIPGVFRSPNDPQSGRDIEEQMRALKPKPKHLHRSPGRPADADAVQLDPAGASYSSSVGVTSESLPPLRTSRPQGPFREPAEVRAQRYRPFEPSLRVETGYTELDEARKIAKLIDWEQRVTDAPFVPVYHLHKPYERLHWSSTQYGHPAYGTQHFREVDKALFLGNNDFLGVLPPIPMFDRLNQTYSRGEVGL